MAGACIIVLEHRRTAGICGVFFLSDNGGSSYQVRKQGVSSKVVGEGIMPLSQTLRSGFRHVSLPWLST